MELADSLENNAKRDRLDTKSKCVRLASRCPVFINDEALLIACASCKIPGVEGSRQIIWCLPGSRFRSAAIYFAVSCSAPPQTGWL